VIGERARWTRYDREEDKHIQEEGRVVAVHHGLKWQILVVTDEGFFRTPDFECVKIEATASAPDCSQATCESSDALMYLEKYLEENFPDTNHGGGPIEWSTSLLSQLKSELVEIGTERDRLRTANDLLVKELKSAKASARRAAKDSGPKGPGEETQ
jgi:hypothetical protein